MSRRPHTVVRLLIPLLVVLALTAITSRMLQAAPPTDTQASGAIVYALQSNNTLISFDSANPGTIRRTSAVTGLQAGENLVGIDFRPASTELYAVSNQSRIYTLNPTTGAATVVGAGPFSPAVNGTAFGLDFNPTVDRIRLTSDADQNLRLHPVTGAVAANDGALAYAVGDPNAGQNPNIAGSAYTNNFYGSTTTTLYNIDSNLNALVTQTPPNSGTLNTVGSLGVDITANAGFDISAEGAAFAALDTGSGASLYQVNLGTGAASLVGGIGAGNVTVVGIAVSAPPFYVYGVDTANNLHLFYSNDTSQIINTTPIGGLQVGETIRGIDIRPATGELYAIGSTSRLYKIDYVSGAATVVGSGPLTTTLNGTDFGFDFNPTVDRIRLTSNADQNLRLNPNTGTVGAVDGTLTYAPTDTNSAANPNIVGSAYTNNFANFGATTLFNIDSNLDTLVRQAPPNDGTLNTVGPLGIDVGANVGFDIPAGLGPNQYAFASAQVGGVYGLYSVNLTTGGAVSVGNIATGAVPIVDIAVATRTINAYLLSANGTIIYGINSANPSYLLAQYNVSGLQAGETLLSLDTRPATGDLFALGSTGRLYNVAYGTGVATQVGSNPLTVTVTGPGIGFDFNPTVDRLRINTSTDQNLRVNPNTGTIGAVDGTLAYATGDVNAGQNPNIAAAAYTNNFAGASMTTLYNLDSNLDILVSQTPPNSGTLNTIGSLGINIGDDTGFDIDDNSPQVALATVNFTSPPTMDTFTWDAERGPDGGATALYSIDLTTGRATIVGYFGATVKDIALNLYRVSPTAVTVSSLDSGNDTSMFVPAIAGIAILGLLGAGLLLRRRR